MPRQTAMCIYCSPTGTKRHVAEVIMSTCRSQGMNVYEQSDAKEAKPACKKGL